MTISKVKLGCKIIALLLLVAIVFHWNIYRIFATHRLPLGWYVVIVAAIVVFALLNVIAAVGMFWYKPWGFHMSYIAVIYSTLFFATNYIPGLSFLYPIHERIDILYLSNFVVLIAIGALHYLSSRNRQM